MQTLFLSPWSLYWVAAVTVVLLVLVGLRLHKERSYAKTGKQVPAIILRVLVVLALLWMALNPTKLLPRVSPDKPVLTVLVDTSMSMSTVDSGEDKSRIAKALSALTDSSTLNTLEDAFRLDIKRFDSSLSATKLDELTADSAKGRASDLAAALNIAVREQAESQARAGILLVSDGRVTTDGVPEATRLALAQAVPVWACPLGGEIPRRDLWVEVPQSEVLAFSEDQVDITATVKQIGFDYRTFPVELFVDGKETERFEVVPDEKGEGKVHCRVTAPAEGEAECTFRIPVQPQEAETENNSRAVFLRAVGHKAKVLLVEGEPHWDTKFLVQSLKRSPRVDLTAVYRLTQDRQFTVISSEGKQTRSEEESFPRDWAGFEQYDIIIFGRGCETFFDNSTESLLTRFVSTHGGGIVFCRGKGYSGRFPALGKFDPVVWGDSSMHGVKLSPVWSIADNPMADLGQKSDVDELLSRLPRLDSIDTATGIKPLAEVLAKPEGTEEEAPIITSQRFGLGRVVSLNAGGLWRWSFHKKGRSEDEQVYDQFCLGVLRWLLSGGDFLAGETVALRSERRLYTDEQPLRFLVRTRGLDVKKYSPSFSITPKSGEAMAFTPRWLKEGGFLVEAGPFAPGQYNVKLVNNIGKPKETTIEVKVVSASLENRNLSSDTELLSRVAKESEGAVISLDQIGQLDQIVRDWQARRQLSEQKVTLWDRWWLLVVLVAALGGEWYLRRREGLL